MNMEAVRFIETLASFCLAAQLRVTDFEKTMDCILSCLIDEMLLHCSLV